ncbi:hypothetical protein [Microbacterium aerolatum]|uniref:hypothetical protein n=1 Tax=Microbacterium aerolatum TaxID=153731 RepID=UPI0011BDA6B6|nr:hypothetical protein [Microbacterium aerolatum]
MAEYVAEYATPYGRAHSFIRTDDLPTPELAHALAARWVEIAEVNPSAVGIIRGAIVRLCKHMASQIGFDTRNHSLGDLRRRHIVSWESTLLTMQAEVHTDTPYRYAVIMFAFLRYIEDRHPGSLHPEVYTKVRQPTRLAHIRGQPRADYSDDELRRIKAAVRSLVRPDGEWTTRAVADVIIAFHVALCISTGEPPEVLRILKLDDITATSSDPRSEGMSTEQIASGRIADSYTVTLRKNRAHIVEDVTWTRRKHATTVRYLDALIALGEPLRRQTRERSLWMLENESGMPTPAPWKRLSLTDWFGSYVRGEISLPHHIGRFRKSAIAAEIIAEPAHYLRTQRRHTQDMLFDHYTNSPTLRQDAGERLVRSISELRDRALGPTVDTGDGIVQIDPTTSQVMQLNETSLPESVGGALTGCRDPENSPHAPLGKVCPMSRMGTCFTCPNAIVTTEHLPALILVNSVSAPDAAADKTTWQKVWGAIHAATTTILQMFPPTAVDEARQHTDEVLVDLGLRHEMRGPVDG